MRYVAVSDEDARAVRDNPPMIDYIEALAILDQDCTSGKGALVWERRPKNAALAERMLRRARGVADREDRED